MIYAVLFSFCTDCIQTDAIIVVENVNLFTRVNQTIRGQGGCLCIFFNKSHNWQITLCTNTDFIDICSFSLFGDKVFLILDFKTSTFCHQGARQRSKHDVKMTHAQLIEISFTPDLVSCAFHLTIYNVTVPLHILFDQICSRIISKFFKVFIWLPCVSLLTVRYLFFWRWVVYLHPGLDTSPSQFNHQHKPLPILACSTETI